MGRDVNVFIILKNDRFRYENDDKKKRKRKDRFFLKSLFLKKFFLYVGALVKRHTDLCCRRTLKKIVRI